MEQLNANMKLAQKQIKPQMTQLYQHTQQRQNQIILQQQKRKTKQTQHLHNAQWFVTQNFWK